MTETPETPAVAKVEPTMTTSEHRGYKIHARIKVGYDTINDRKHKTYGSKVFYLFTIENEETTCNADSKVWGAPFEEKIKQRFPGLAVKVDASNGWHPDATGRLSIRTVDVIVSFTIKAEKPSKIQKLVETVLAVEKVFATDEAIQDRILHGITAALDVKVDKLAQEQRRRDGDMIAKSLASRAHEIAKQRINYDARLAGLKAELDVTRKQELESLSKDLIAKAGETKLRGEVVDRRSIDAGIKHAPEALPTGDPFFGSMDRDMTTLDEVR